MRDEALREMSGSPLRGGVTSSGYRTFRELLAYKLERQGKPLILIDRYAPTTRTCSVCGLRQDGVDYGAKSWACPRCGTTHDREVNAAKNIKAQGLAQLGKSA